MFTWRMDGREGRGGLVVGWEDDGVGGGEGGGVTEGGGLGEVDLDDVVEVAVERVDEVGLLGGRLR